VVLDLTFEFEVRGVLTIERWAIDKAVSPADPAFEYVYQPCAAKDLDVPLKPVHLERPAFPEEFAKQGIRGTAVVDFYVDEQGRARIPVATQAQHDVLASLARQAVSQWQFQPPTRNGKPVLVKVSQRFAFTE
jgi:TonB family protein